MMISLLSYRISCHCRVLMLVVRTVLGICSVLVSFSFVLGVGSICGIFRISLGKCRMIILLLLRLNSRPATGRFFSLGVLESILAIVTESISDVSNV